MNLDKLKELATNASPLPWEPPSDVPHSVRWAFREAVRPEDVLALIEVAEKAKAYLDSEGSGCGAEVEHEAALSSALSRLNGGQE